MHQACIKATSAQAEIAIHAQELVALNAQLASAEERIATLEGRLSSTEQDGGAQLASTLSAKKIEDRLEKALCCTLSDIDAVSTLAECLLQYAEKCQARDAELQGLRVQLQQAYEDLLDCRCQLDETFQENEEEIEAFRMKAEGALRSSLSLKDAEIEELLRTKDRFYSEALQDKDEQILKMKSGVHELILRRAVSRMIHRNLWHSFAHWHGMCQEAKKLRLVLGRSLGRWSNRRIARTFQAWMQFVAARKHQSLAEMLEDLEEQRLSDEELVMKAHEALAAKAEELEQCVSLRQKDEQLLLKAHAALAEKDAEIARLCGLCHG